MKSGMYLVRIHWLASLLVVLLFLPAGCDVAQPGSQSVGLHIHSTNSSIDWSTHLCVAYLAADAGIASLGASHWNTPNGSRPAAADEQTVVRDGYAIYRPLQFSYMHIHRDQRHQPTAEFDTIGGQVGADRYISDASPQMNTGTTYLLVFFSGVPLQGQAHTEKLMVVDEAFLIDGQGIVTLHAAHDEGKGADTQHYPAVTMPLSQITQQLASCK